MRIPKYLSEDRLAIEFWKRHCSDCVNNGSLTDETIDSFALVCRIWSVLQRTNPDVDSKAAMKFASLLKYYQTYAKPFGLLGSKAPSGKKTSIADLLKDVSSAEESKAD